MCYSLMMFHAASALKITGFGWTVDPEVEINYPSFLRKNVSEIVKNNYVFQPFSNSVVNDTVVVFYSIPLWNPYSTYVLSSLTAAFSWQLFVSALLLHRYVP